MNHFLKNIEGNLFIIYEEDRPKREDYIVGDNNSLITEDYFLDLKKWESSICKYECHPSQAPAFLELALRHVDSLSDFNDELLIGILLNTDSIVIENNFAHLKIEEND